MSVVSELEEKALGLSKMDRGKLISKLIDSLGSPFEDDDEDAWIEEAARRDKQMDDDPESVLTHEQFMEGLAEFRR